MEQKTVTIEAEKQELQPPENIFSELADIRPYERTMKNARGWMYAIVVVQFLIGFYEYFTVDDNYIAALAFGIDALIGMIFLLLIFWSKKKPFAAFTTALVLYILIEIGLIMMDPSNLTKGIIMEILVIIALGKAVRDAKEYERVKQAVGQ